MRWWLSGAGPARCGFADEAEFVFGEVVVAVDGVVGPVGQLLVEGGSAGVPAAGAAAAPRASAGAADKHAAGAAGSFCFDHLEGRG